MSLPSSDFFFNYNFFIIGGYRETERKKARKKGREAGRPPELNTLKQTGDLNPDGLGTVFLLLTIWLSCLPSPSLTTLI